MNDAARRHHEIAANFTRLVTGTHDWQAPTPVAGWQARDVVGHLVGWLPALLASGAQITLPAASVGVEVDPVAAWREHTAAVQALLEDSSTADATMTSSPLAGMPVLAAVDMAYTTDIFLHSWDLARATGQPDGLDPQTCAGLLQGMEPMDEVLRSSGQYGPRIPVADDADPVSRLAAFIGRDPAWTPIAAPAG